MFQDGECSGMKTRPVALSEISFADLSLYQRPFPAAFDGLSKIAARLLKVPVALVSIIDETNDRQIFAGAHGLKSPLAELRETPLSHSFCKTVTETGKPFVVEDARKHPKVHDNPSIRDLKVLAYLGVPICGSQGGTIGALCAISTKPRKWKKEDLEALEELAICVNEEILLRAALQTSEEMIQQAKRYSAARESIAAAFAAPGLSVEDRFAELLRASCRALDVDCGWISKLSAGKADELFTSCNHLSIVDTEIFNGSNCIAKEALEALRAYTLAEQRLVYYSGRGRAPIECCRADRSGLAERYISAPLIINGVVYGVIDFATNRATGKPWQEEEISILSLISMICCSNLDTFDQIRMLKASESELLCQMSTLRERSEPAMSSR